MSKEVLIINLNSDDQYQPILDSRSQSCGMRSGRVVLHVGQSCGWHSTNACEEVLIFLSGRGTALIGEKQTTYQVGKEKILYIPPNTIHNIENTGDKPLIYIYCVAPVASDSINSS